MEYSLYFEAPAIFEVLGGGRLRFDPGDSSILQVPLRIECSRIQTDSEQCDVLHLRSFVTDESGNEYSCCEYASARDLFLHAARDYLLARDFVFDPRDVLTGEEVFEIVEESPIVEGLSYYDDGREHFPLMAWKRRDGAKHNCALLFYRFRTHYASATIDLVEIVKARSGRPLPRKPFLRIQFMSDVESAAAVDSSEKPLDMDPVGLHAASPFYAEFSWNHVIWRNLAHRVSAMDSDDEREHWVSSPRGARLRIERTGNTGPATPGISLVP